MQFSAKILPNNRFLPQTQYLAPLRSEKSWICHWLNVFVSQFALQKNEWPNFHQQAKRHRNYYKNTGDSYKWSLQPHLELNAKMPFTLLSIRLVNLIVFISQPQNLFANMWHPFKSKQQNHSSKNSDYKPQGFNSDNRSIMYEGSITIFNM